MPRIKQTALKSTTSKAPAFSKNGVKGACIQKKTKDGISSKKASLVTAQDTLNAAAAKMARYKATPESARKWHKRHQQIASTGGAHFLGGGKVKRKWRSGTVAVREIKKLSRTTHLLFPKAPFSRLVRELAIDFRSDIRFTEKAMDTIQDVAEAFVTENFIKANMARRHANRETLHVNDVQFAKFMVFQHGINAPIIKKTLQQEDKKPKVDGGKEKEKKVVASSGGGGSAQDAQKKVAEKKEEQAAKNSSSQGQGNNNKSKKSVAMAVEKGNEKKEDVDDDDDEEMEDVEQQEEEE